MKILEKMITRRLTRLSSISCWPYSTAAAVAQTTQSPSECRTNESEVAKHTAELHSGKFYTIPPEHKKQLFTGGGLPKPYEKQIKTFTETCLMIRPAALELLQYMRNVDFSRPVVRFVLYGDNGVGKSLTMAHMLHYGLQNGFLLVHIPWVPYWMKHSKEQANSTFHEGMIDLPFDAAAWLVHFKNQNGKLLSAPELKTSKEYVWSKRESTPAGSTLTELVEHGIARIKFATETIAALVNELKQHATAGRCKVMVAIDGFNSFFHPVTYIYGDNKQCIPPEQLTITQPFLEITKPDWTNGVCILTVDKIAMTEGYFDSYMPRYLLGKLGFEHLDPFVPVRVENYSEKEFASCISYYIDRNWIQKRPEGFDEQLKFMSNRNPYALMQLTRSL